jgi:hypothetical protein
LNALKKLIFLKTKTDGASNIITGPRHPIIITQDLDINGLHALPLSAGRTVADHHFGDRTIKRVRLSNFGVCSTVAMS